MERAESGRIGEDSVIARDRLRMREGKIMVVGTALHVKKSCIKFGALFGERTVAKSIISSIPSSRSASKRG